MRQADFDNILANARANNIHMWVKPMSTLDLKAFIRHIEQGMHLIPAGPRKQEVDLIRRGALSELLMPHRLADLRAQMPKPEPEREMLPLNLTAFEVELSQLLLRHTMDMRCKVPAPALAKFMGGVLVSLANVQGVPAVAPGAQAPNP